MHHSDDRLWWWEINICLSVAVLGSLVCSRDDAGAGDASWVEGTIAVGVRSASSESYR